MPTKSGGAAPQSQERSRTRPASGGGERNRPASVCLRTYHQAMAEDNVIHIGSAPSLRVVPGLGQLSFRGASIGLEEELAAHHERPLRVNHRAFVNELISGTVKPPLTPSQVDALSERSRAALRNGVVGACELRPTLLSLRGSTLSADERLFATMLWHYEEWTAEMAMMAAALGLACAKHVSKAIQSLKPQLNQLASNILGASGLGGRVSKMLSGLLPPMPNWATRALWVPAVQLPRAPLFDLEAIIGRQRSDAVTQTLAGMSRAYGFAVNVGTVSAAPHPPVLGLADGKVRRRLMPPGWDGGPVPGHPDPNAMDRDGVISWRAGCAETCTSGSEGGPGKRTGGNTGTAPRSDPYTAITGTV